MRRILFFLLLFTGLLTIIVGIVEAQTWHTGLAVHHIVIASTFIVVCLIHIFLKRKAVIRYIMGVK